MMKRFFLLLFSAAMLTTFAQATSKHSSDGQSDKVSPIDTLREHVIYKGRLVEVCVEKAIYHWASGSNFFMKFTIINLSDQSVGVDLSNYQKVVYPNQWGIYPKPYREVVDEEQIIPDQKIDAAALIKKYKDKALTLIKPHDTLSYYRDWNGSGEKVEVSDKESYLIISVDGQMLFTDGISVEHLTLNLATEAQRIVVMPFPVIHKTVPENARIIKQ